MFGLWWAVDAYPVLIWVEKKRLPFCCQFNEKPSIIPGCPGVDMSIINVQLLCAPQRAKWHMHPWDSQRILNRVRTTSSGSFKHHSNIGHLLGVHWSTWNYARCCCAVRVKSYSYEDMKNMKAYSSYHHKNRICLPSRATHCKISLQTSAPQATPQCLGDGEQWMPGLQKHSSLLSIDLSTVLLLTGVHRQFLLQNQLHVSCIKQLFARLKSCKLTVGS